MFLNNGLQAPAVTVYFEQNSKRNEHFYRYANIYYNIITIVYENGECVSCGSDFRVTRNVRACTFGIRMSIGGENNGKNPVNQSTFWFWKKLFWLAINFVSAHIVDVPYS